MRVPGPGEFVWLYRRDGSCTVVALREHSDGRVMPLVRNPFLRALFRFKFSSKRSRRPQRFTL